MSASVFYMKIPDMSILPFSDMRIFALPCVFLLLFATYGICPISISKFLGFNDFWPPFDNFVILHNSECLLLCILSLRSPAFQCSFVLILNMSDFNRKTGSNTKKRAFFVFCFQYNPFAR